MTEQSSQSERSGSTCLRRPASRHAGICLGPRCESAPKWDPFSSPGKHLIFVRKFVRGVVSVLIHNQLFNSSEKRLARLLLLLANYGKEGSPRIAPVTISQETLAAMVGTTRSRVSHFMNKFRKSGFIDYSGIEHNGKIKVRQPLLNSLLHDKPQIREDELVAISGMSKC